MIEWCGIQDGRIGIVEDRLNTLDRILVHVNEGNDEFHELKIV